MMEGTPGARRRRRTHKTRRSGTSSRARGRGRASTGRAAAANSNGGAAPRRGRRPRSRRSRAAAAGGRRRARARPASMRVVRESSDKQHARPVGSATATEGRRQKLTGHRKQTPTANSTAASAFVLPPATARPRTTYRSTGPTPGAGGGGRQRTSTTLSRASPSTYSESFASTLNGDRGRSLGGAFNNSRMASRSAAVCRPGGASTSVGAAAPARSSRRALAASPHSTAPARGAGRSSPGAGSAPAASSSSTHRAKPPGASGSGRLRYACAAPGPPASAQPAAR